MLLPENGAWVLPHLTPATRDASSAGQVPVGLQSALGMDVLVLRRVSTLRDKAAGTVDVVFEEGEALTVLDFKTYREPSDLEDQYERQLTLYCRAFASLSGRTSEILRYG